MQDTQGRASHPSFSFPDVLDHLYFRRRCLVAPVVEELRKHHQGASEHAGPSAAMLDWITRRLQPNPDPKDLSNAVSVIVADIICPEATDGGGCVSLAEVEVNHGPLLSGVLSRLLTDPPAETGADPPGDPVARNEMLRHVSVFAPCRMGEVVAREKIPDNLPLIDYLIDKLGQVSSSIRSLVCVQHLFGSTVPLIQAITRNGIEPGGVFILGKPYSTNYAAMWRLREGHGYFVHPGSCDLQGVREQHQDADRNVQRLLLMCVRWMGARRSSGGQRALLIDDGGRAIRMLHDDRFRDVASRFTCVEQTRRGIWELEGVQLQTPVVNVADSRAKLDYESPLIAQSIHRELLERITVLRDADIEIDDSVLVIGYGAIGEAVAKQMRMGGYRVGVRDTSEERMFAAECAEFTVEPDLKEALQRYQVILGCTGTEVMGYDDYACLRDGAVLVSASSADIEFGAWRLRGHATSLFERHRRVDDMNLVYERVQNRWVRLGDPDAPCHFLYVVRYGGRKFFLVNGGFPVNMTGAVDPIESERIQLTRALLYAGAVQASREREAGLHDLDGDVQEWVIGEYRRLTNNRR